MSMSVAASPSKGMGGGGNRDYKVGSFVLDW